jgi:hypothetical protein
VRRAIAACLLLIAWSSVWAQDQEQKLIDRLLRPDMNLKNGAQNKKFIADGASADKRATVGAFYVQEKSNAKKFSGTRDFAAPKFQSRFSQAGNKKANLLSRNQVPNSRSTYSVARTINPPAARDAKKTVASRDYSGNRPFLDRGKSQKSLNRQNPPMTIDQVRDLLNKNK